MYGSEHRHLLSSIQLEPSGRKQKFMVTGRNESSNTSEEKRRDLSEDRIKVGEWTLNRK